MANKLWTHTKTYIDGFLSLVYPEFCEVCERELNSQNKHICFVCESDLHFTYFEKYKEVTPADEVFWGRLLLENVYSLLYYQKGNSTQKILYRIKYQEGRELAHFMGKTMIKRMYLSDKYSDIDAIIPIPLHSKKQFSRGYNQSLLIAEGMAKESGLPIVEAIYRKTNDTSQTRKSKEERYQNVKGKFHLKEGSLKNCVHVLIVDDVLTTGATLEFACRAVMESPVPVKISLATIALAHR